jgi:hypothetical protein
MAIKSHESFMNRKYRESVSTCRVFGKPRKS